MPPDTTAGVRRQDRATIGGVALEDFMRSKIGFSLALAVALTSFGCGGDDDASSSGSPSSGSATGGAGATGSSAGGSGGQGGTSTATSSATSSATTATTGG